MASPSIASQLRHRRAASYRCPVMADGRRDTLDRPKIRVPTTVRILGGGTDEFDGPGALGAIRSLGIRYMRSRTGHGWWIQAKHTEDVLTLLGLRGYTVQELL